MSETCPFITVAAYRSLQDQEDSDAKLAALTASGITVPLVSARIVDEKMNDLPHDGQTRGELVLRSPWLTSSYVGDREASDALWRGGWLHTQDIATIDSQGQLRIRDRLKDVIKTGGEWVDSLQLEELVASAVGVAEAAVIAVPDKKWGERPLAVVVPKDGASLTLDILNVPVEQAIAQGAITRYAKLDRFTVIEALPRTSVGKLDKKLLRARFVQTEPH
jgi:fatty-acyl-CoA synthase